MHLDLFQLVGIMLSVLLSGAAYVPLAGRSSVGGTGGSAGAYGVRGKWMLGVGIPMSLAAS